MIHQQVYRSAQSGTLDHNIVYTYNYSLILGDLKKLRLRS